MLTRAFVTMQLKKQMRLRVRPERPAAPGPSKWSNPVLGPGKVGHCVQCGDWRLIIDGRGHCFACAKPV